MMGHVSSTAVIAQIFTHFACTGGAKVRAWWVKISQCCFRKESQNMQELSRRYKLVRKVRVAAGAEGSRLCCAQCSAPWSSKWVLVLVFHLWKFATSASQIKSETSFATMAKKAILHFIGLLKPFSIENKNNRKVGREKRLHFHSRFYSLMLQMFLGQTWTCL